jgi:putative Holliday junction resolvase
MRYLGIDFGLKKIGLSLGDDQTKMALPIETIKNSEQVFYSLSDLIEQENIGAVVVGVPVQSDTSFNSAQFDITNEFINNLEKAINLPVYRVDERYTTSESKRLIKEFGAQASEDSLSAMLILQAYFDELN